jgi:hypothetical protein
MTLDSSKYQVSWVNRLKSTQFILLCLAITAILSNKSPAQRACPAFTKVDGTTIAPISKNDTIFKFAGGYVAIVREMQVDTDGSPVAYHPQDLGTSPLCDGLDPYDTNAHECDLDKKKGNACFPAVKKAFDAKWDASKSGPFCTYGFDAPGISAPGTKRRVWGKVFGNGLIPMQYATDPAPGFFISSTSFDDPRNRGKHMHYIDADVVPYVVVPGSLVGRGKDFPGHPTAAWAWSTRTGFESPAVIGDTQSHFGEGSVALVQALEKNSINPIKPTQVLGTGTDALPFPYVKKNGAIRATSGATDTIVFLYFTKGAAVIDLSNEGIAAAATKAFNVLGGHNSMKTCLMDLVNKN